MAGRGVLAAAMIDAATDPDGFRVFVRDGLAPAPPRTPGTDRARPGSYTRRRAGRPTPAPGQYSNALPNRARNCR